LVPENKKFGLFLAKAEGLAITIDNCTKRQSKPLPL
jgi:hypothetical protein